MNIVKSVLLNNAKVSSRRGAKRRFSHFRSHFRAFSIRAFSEETWGWCRLWSSRREEASALTTSSRAFWRSESSASWAPSTTTSARWLLPNYSSFNPRIPRSRSTCTSILRAVPSPPASPSTTRCSTWSLQLRLGASAKPAPWDLCCWPRVSRECDTRCPIHESWSTSRRAVPADKRPTSRSRRRKSWRSRRNWRRFTRSTRMGEHRSTFWWRRWSATRSSTRRRRSSSDWSIACWNIRRQSRRTTKTIKVVGSFVRLRKKKLK